MSRTSIGIQKYDPSWICPSTPTENINKEISSSNNENNSNLSINNLNNIATKQLETLDNRQAKSSTMLLPSQTLPRDSNQHMLQNTPLKISVKKTFIGSGSFFLFV